jgi:metallo-beta-lactamase family protein
MGRLSFLGAARTVTGSQYLVEAGARRLMVDCGMFQGPKALRERNWAAPAFDPASLEVLILTHTHLDHIGRVPRLVKQGFKGRILCTPPTLELADVLLKDAAHLQEEDAAYLNRKGLTKHTPAEPLFDAHDVEVAMRHFAPVPIDTPQRLSDAFSFVFREAGHLLGAASALVEATEAGRTTRLLFSGDVGRYGAVLTKDPAPAADAELVLMESTYGNRSHADVPILDQLEGVLKRTFARGGVLLIPAFAVGRAQQMLVLMDQIVREGRLRPFPIHVDSPMAVDATRIYAEFPDSHRVSLASALGQSAFHGRYVQFHRTTEESKALNAMKGPGVILSSSGMLSGGRILHHCRIRLPHPENTLLITGYQAEGTLGRALIDRAKVVRIHKSEVPVLAEVTDLKGLSGHGDAGEMVRWLSGMKTPPRTVFLTHGEPDAAFALADRVRRELGFATAVPAPDESVAF